MFLSSCLQLFLSIPFGDRQTILSDPSNKPMVLDEGPGDGIVKLENGTIAGAFLPRYNQHAWLGIPYAKPPVGENRYRRPQSVTEGWKDVRIYNKSSPFCIGYGSDQAAYESSEDCLTINIIRPDGNFDQPLPVAAWIHGGGYFKGSANDLRYNLSFIVQQSVKSDQPMIGVSFNYRLGPWGFLAGPAMKDTGNSNLGLHDQRLALHWIQENIHAFGGDPEKVTIWGESAGAGSVGFHLLAYGGEDHGLFRGAIMQSGSPIPMLAFQTPEEKSGIYKNITWRLDCPAEGEASLECLRNKTVEELNQAYDRRAATPIGTFYNETESWTPVLDGDFLRIPPTTQLARKQYVDVPVIVGTCADEGTAYGPIPGPSDIFEAIAYFAGTQAAPVNLTFTDQLMEAYPLERTVGPPYRINEGGYKGFLLDKGMTLQYRRTAAYFGDYLFIAAHRKTCETWTSHGHPAYCFRFNAQSAGQPWHFGVKHLQDIAFVFYNLDGDGYDAAHNSTQGVNPFQDKPQSYADLADLMSRSWVSFVHDLDPNSFRARGIEFEGVPPWPLYGDDAQQLLFDADVGTRIETDNYRSKGIGLINDNPERWNR